MRFGNQVYYTSAAVTYRPDRVDMGEEGLREEFWKAIGELEHVY